MSAFSDLVSAEASLLSWIRFDQESGNFTDLGPSAITGTPSGSGVTRVGSRIGLDKSGAVFLDDSFPGDIRFGDVHDFTATNPFSFIMVWTPFKYDSDGYLLFKRASGAGGIEWSSNSAVMACRRYDSGGVDDGAFTDQVLQPYQTYLLGFTYDGTTIRLIRDGVQMHSIASSRSVPNVTEQLCLGSALGGSGAHGVVDEFIVCSTAISAATQLTWYRAMGYPARSQSLDFDYSR